MSEPQGTVILVEDDDEVRNSIKRYLHGLGYTVYFYENAIAFINDLPRLPPADCVVSDVKMPWIDGVELIERLRALGRDEPVVLITGHGDLELAVKAMKRGAFDFHEKPLDPSKLVQSIQDARQVRRGNLQHRIREARRRIQNLTDRQREVVVLVADGLTSRQIAAQLGTSPRTVDIHRAASMERTGTSSIAELVRLQLLADLDDAAMRAPAL